MSAQRDALTNAFLRDWCDLTVPDTPVEEAMKHMEHYWSAVLAGRSPADIGALGMELVARLQRVTHAAQERELEIQQPVLSNTA